MYSLSALYMLQYVPIVMYSCKLLYSKKKKKKKEKKKKLFPWEREGILTSPNFI